VDPHPDHFGRRRSVSAMVGQVSNRRCPSARPGVRQSANSLLVPLSRTSDGDQSLRPVRPGFPSPVRKCTWLRRPVSCRTEEQYAEPEYAGLSFGLDPRDRQPSVEKIESAADAPRRTPVTLAASMARRLWPARLFAADECPQRWGSRAARRAPQKGLRRKDRAAARINEKCEGVPWSSACRYPKIPCMKPLLGFPWPPKSSPSTAPDVQHLSPGRPRPGSSPRTRSCFGNPALPPFSFPEQTPASGPSPLLDAAAGAPQW